MNRFELDTIREDQRKVSKARAAELQLIKAIAEQTNSNTKMLQRWLAGSPALQAIEKNVGRKESRKIILPPHADLRVSDRDVAAVGALTLATK